MHVFISDLAFRWPIGKLEMGQTCIFLFSRQEKVKRVVGIINYIETNAHNTSIGAYETKQGFGIPNLRSARSHFR
jgi:hypothetical protein